MARLHDVPVVLRTVGFIPFARRVWDEVLDDHIFLFAGTLAYAWLFALFPFFIFLLNLVPHLPGARQDKVLEDASIFLHAVLPTTAADQINNVLSRQMPKSAGVIDWALGLSLMIALWATSGGITVTMAVLDKCYELQKVRAYLTRRPMAFVLTLVVTALMIAMVLLVPAQVQADEWLRQRGIEMLAPVVHVCRGAVAIALAFLILAVLYHFGPCVKRKWRTVTPGAVFCMVVWVVLALAFRAYVDLFSGSRYEATYGTAGWLVILLVVLYLDALVLLIGAEINSEIDFEVRKVPRGSKNFRHAEQALRERERVTLPLSASAPARSRV